MPEKGCACSGCEVFNARGVGVGNGPPCALFFHKAQQLSLIHICPESRRQNFYYGHPRNRFWPLLAALLGTAVPCTVEEKTALVCAHGLALWDTVQQCTITGAQDASIRNVTPTDIPWLCAAAPIRRVLCLSLIHI